MRLPIERSPTQRSDSHAVGAAARGADLSDQKLHGAPVGEATTVADLHPLLRRRGQDLSIPKLALLTNLSERHFSRLFKAEVGVGPAEHIEAVRLDSACRLIESTHLTIEQVAITCGFGAVETMNRAFRRRLGTTPLQHRHHFDQTHVASSIDGVALQA